MQRQAALLFWRFGRDEPHVRPSDCLTDRFGVDSIVLMPLHVGLHIGRRHQPHSVAKRLEFARPMVRRSAGFDTDQTRRQLLEECHYVAPLQLPADDYVALRTDAVDLKNRLRDV